jgi:hypothetical protein
MFHPDTKNKVCSIFANFTQNIRNENILLSIFQKPSSYSQNPLTTRFTSFLQN